jgi:glycosyltransferase involved in cell wall biosynthesis
MNKRKKLFIIYDWFYPGFKAGGPIQSLTNLAKTLVDDFDVYVITGSTDLQSDVNYTGITLNSWQEINLPATDRSINVFYADAARLSKDLFQSLFSQIKPDVVYLNGIFSYRFFMMPMLALRAIDDNTKVVVCPRGMLKKGALEGKSLKKKIYIRAVKLSGLLNEVYWHATSPEEAKDIASHYPVNQGIMVAANIPKKPFSDISFIDKEKGKLRLVYLSLINQHKNLDLLLRFLKGLEKSDVSLDIYGPVVDEAYWRRCQALLAQMPGKVQYKGGIEPGMVQQVLSQYHAAVLLTRGENFGHALYESLSVARPVITSNFTPWQNLYENKAGVNVDINNINDCSQKIRQFVDMEADEYHGFCIGAYKLAKEYYSNLNAREKYKKILLSI